MKQLDHKTELRRRILNQRKSLSSSQWREQSDHICQQLQSFSLWQQATTVLAYFSFRQEPDLSPLFTSPHRWGFPRCVKQSLVWHSWQPNQPLQQGKYGIQEPFYEAKIIEPHEVDLILVPTVACDRRGYRLGYGGGFYDRMLSHPQWRNKPTVGIVFNSAYLPALPIESWDIKLDYICTEKTLLFVNS